MCGIIGFLGNDNCIEYIINGLNMLQNRGYDSVGIALIDCSDNLQIIKRASTDTNNSFATVKDEVLAKHLIGNVGIGHTRWATHGGKTDINAHPHTCMNNEFIVVHNGIIENYLELKDMLSKHGYIFYTQTDTEIICNLISHFSKSSSVLLAIDKTIKLLSGSWALTIVSKSEPNKLWITRNGSPLLLGYTDTYVMISSERSGFCNYINQYMPIDNHDIIEVSYNNGKIDISTDIDVNRLISTDDSTIELTPYPYEYWMIKEIYFQPQASINAINNGGRISSDSTVKLGGLEQYKHLLLNVEHLVFLGCGTSLNAGYWASYMFKASKIFKSVTVVDGAEFCDLDIPSRKTAFIMLSQSGETRDLIRCFSLLDNYTTIGVINVTDSEIARQTTCGVYLNAGRENAVASTKSFTSQCIVLMLILVWYGQNKDMCLQLRTQIINDTRMMFSHITQVLRMNNKITDMVKSIVNHKSCFVLGKGSCTAIANEGALKLKEISYIHAEGYSSSALKHGPFALIEEGTPVIILDTDEINHDNNMNALHETKARNANVITIGIFSDNTLQISKNKTYSGVIANIYIQYLAYNIALEKGINPDFPRNLAKVVTVS